MEPTGTEHDEYGLRNGSFYIKKPLLLRTIFDPTSYGGRTRAMSASEADSHSSKREIDLRATDSIFSRKRAVSDLPKPSHPLDCPEADAGKTHTLHAVLKCKTFLEDYYWDLVSYHSSRMKREEDFQKVLRNASNFERDSLIRQHRRSEAVLLRSKRTGSRKNDFVKLKRIGQGAFGEVILCVHRKTNEVLAVKKLSKAAVYARKNLPHVETEKELLSNKSSEWLVHLQYAFQDHSSLFFAMEYVPGGDFLTYLQSVEVLSEKDARFYFAEMCLAVSALHDLGYIHRDLKPDNFLIDATGHLKLSDFGLSKKSRYEFSANFRGQMPTINPALAQLQKNYRKKALSLVGTPDYMAVEIVREEPYDQAVDWWSLGCMLFEMITGSTPFPAQHTAEVLRRITEHRRYFRNPKHTNGSFYFSDAAFDLLERLVCEPEVRINSIDAVCRHPFMAGVDMTNIRSLEPPFVPELTDRLDTRYFSYAEPDDEKDGAESEHEEFLDKLKKIDAPSCLDYAKFTFSNTVFAESPRSMVKSPSAHSADAASSEGSFRERSDSHSSGSSFHSMCSHGSGGTAGAVDPQLPALTGLTPADWKKLYAGATRVVMKKGDMVVAQNDFNPNMYRILNGRVRVERAMRGEQKDQEVKVKITTLESNELFGEMALASMFDDVGSISGYSYVVSSDQADLLRVPSAHALSLMAKDSEMFQNFFRVLATGLAHQYLDLPLRKGKIVHSPEDLLTPAVTRRRPPPAAEYNASQLALEDPIKEERQQKFLRSFKLPATEQLLRESKAVLSEEKVITGTVYVGKAVVCFSWKFLNFKKKKMFSLRDVVSVEQWDRDSFVMNLADGGQPKLIIPGHGGDFAKLVGQRLDAVRAAPPQEREKLLDLPSLMNFMSPRILRRNISSPGSPKPLPERVKRGLALTQEDWDSVLHASNCRTYTKGEAIVMQSEVNDDLYQIAGGRVGVEVTSENGLHTVSVGVLSTSDMFGDIAFMSKRGSPASYVALDNFTDVYTITREALDDLFAKQPVLGGKFYKFISTAIARQIQYAETLEEEKMIRG